MDRTEILKSLELAGRCCYKSENKISEISASDFVRMLVQRGHEAMIEHCSITVKFICDRGISHEIVRHRIASYGQESTRYCSYHQDKFGNEITVIKPLFYEEETDKYKEWKTACLESEKRYFNLLNLGSTAQEARSVLPTSLKTEIVVTMNMREWRHFLKLRTASAAHPQMREITIPLLEDLKKKLPELFEDIEVE